jgi:hypothetical protein
VRKKPAILILLAFFIVLYEYTIYLLLLEGQQRLGSQEANKGILPVCTQVCVYIYYRYKKDKTVTDSKIAGNWNSTEDIQITKKN